MKILRSLTFKDPKRYRYLNQLEFYVVRFKEDKWFLDNGCSRHMTGDESKFAFLKKKNGGYVTFGDNAKERMIGQGNIGNGTSSLIESVLLVDGFKHNLLSISQFCDKGF